MKTKLLIILLIAIFSDGAGAAPSKTTKAVSPPNGEKLYKKHCSTCHPDSSSLKGAKDFISLLRDPPAPMPIFIEEKLSDRNAKAIERYLFPNGPDKEKSLPDSAGSVAPATLLPRGSFAIGPDKPLPPIQLTNDPESKIRGFIRKWTIKDALNRTGTAIQKFEIALNANNVLTVAPSTKLAPSALKVTAFEVIGNTLKLQFKWKMKNARTYWKIETYALVMSKDSEALSGIYTVQTIGGQNETRAVIGEKEG